MINTLLKYQTKYKKNELAHIMASFYFELALKSIILK